MLTKLLFQKPKFAQIVLGILFLGLFLIRIFPFPTDWQSITGIVSFLLTLVYFLIFFQSELTQRNGVLSWYLLIWAMVFSGSVTDYRLMIAFFFSTVLFRFLLKSEENSESSKPAFSIGVLLCISSIFFPPSVFLVGFLLFVYLYLNTISLRKILLMIMGFSLPLLIGIQILYLTDYIHILEQYESAFYLNLWDFIPWLLSPILLLLIMAGMDHLRHLSIQDTKKRYKYFLFFIYFLNWIIILILYAGDNEDMLLFVSFPVSVALARFTQYMESNIRKEFILWFYMAVMIIYFFKNELIETYNQLLGNVSFQL